MRLFVQQPEDGISEVWTWLTDVMVSLNGTEQRVCNSDLPKRTFGYPLKFDDADALRAHISAMFMGAGSAFQLPLYQYQTRLTAKANTGATVVAAAGARTELRVGGAALIFDAAGYQLVTVQAVAGAAVTILEPLARPYGVDASLCPVATVFAGNNAVLSRGRMDHAATATLAAKEVGFLDPFVNALNAAVVTTFSGLPVLEARPIGDNYDVTFDTGIQTTEEGGIVDIRSPWNHAQLQLTLSFNCQRILNPADWDKWRKFLDAVKGSWKPFYIPSYATNFKLVTAPAIAGTTLTFGGTSYADDWFPYAPFKTIAVFHDAGVHYATVSAVAKVGGNTNVTFAPALPAGATNPSVCLLYKVRIANDQVSCDHFGQNTRLNLLVRTVDA